MGLRVGCLLFIFQYLLVGAETPAVKKADKAVSRGDWVTPAIEAKRVTHHVFESKALKEKVSYHLYRPAAYEEGSKARFPTRLSRNFCGLATLPPSESRTSR